MFSKPAVGVQRPKKFEVLKNSWHLSMLGIEYMPSTGALYRKWISLQNRKRGFSPGQVIFLRRNRIRQVQLPQPAATVGIVVLPVVKLWYRPNWERNKMGYFLVLNSYGIRCNRCYQFIHSTRGKEGHSSLLCYSDTQRLRRKKQSLNLFCSSSEMLHFACAILHIS